ncbi:unnamed protein product [Nippostrongylus brasiliensis]|uniref:ZP domain-containing protein n=1 Tax=Nippostrongylus brasiliensis TaxID=27835 RepID=A0A0N4Y6S3_NIPBR|nr:unnamed protein product [Nippostrongylus brasiliensis]
MRIISVLLLVLTTCYTLPLILNTSIACDKLIVRTQISHQFQTDFLLRIKFNETFTGLIQTEKGDPNCVYVNASIQQGTDYEVKIPLIGCETKLNREGNYENEITVQGSDRFDSRQDKRYLLTCIPANPIFSHDYLRDSQVTVSFGGVTIDAEATTAMSVTGSPKVEYDVSVRDGDQATAPRLKRPLAVGDRVTYTVRLGPSSRGRIGRCWASDGKSGTTFLNHIKAWAFPTSNEVNIFCNLHVCADCVQTVCRSRPRRVPATGDADSPEADLPPPIPIRASFRLRRQVQPSTTTTIEHDVPAETQLMSIGSRSDLFSYSTAILTLFLGRQWFLLE